MKNERKMKKRSPWLEITLIGSIFLLLALIIGTTLSSGNSKFQNIISANKHQSTIETADTEFDNIQMITETSNDSSLSYRLVYPKTNFESFNEEIKQYIADSKEDYLSTIQNNDNKEGLLNINCTIYPYKENYYSIVFSKELTYDFSKYEYDYQTYFIEKENGAIIRLHNILADNTSYFTKLSKYVQNRLLQSKDLLNQVDKESILNATSPLWENYYQFAFIENQLVFYFNFENLNTNETIQKVEKIDIPFINPILNEDYQSEIKKDTTILSKPKTQTKVNVKKATPISKNNSTSKNTNNNAIKNNNNNNIKNTNTGKKVALTFDDGPHETITKEILSTLDKYNAKATFFVLGTQVKKNKSVLKEIKNRGHEIGNHTYYHKNLTKLKPEEIKNEVDSTNAIIKEVTGSEATVLRPPYGATNDSIKEIVGLPTVLWTVDTLDWKYRDASKLLPSVQSHVRNNSIILMHDIHQSTADGLDSVLAYLQNEGYEFVTVSELLSY